MSIARASAAEVAAFVAAHPAWTLLDGKLRREFRFADFVQAFGFSDVSLGLSGAVFVALIGSLLTAVPLSPAGLGIVEAGIVGVLTVAYGVPLAEATAIALLDRVISVFSIIVLGTIGYLASSKPRGLRAIAQPGESASN